MTTSGQTKYRPPLTSEQQATVVKWRPLGIKYMLKALRGRGLGHFEDEAEGLAHWALMEAVRVWRPADGPFPACLKFWVRNTADKFSAHGARTVQQSEHAREYVNAWSLDAPLKRTDGTLEGSTWQDMLANEVEDDPSENVDARRLARALPILLPVFMARKNERRYALAYAEESFRLWWIRNFGESDATLDSLGVQLRISRERVRQRVEKVQAEFELWADPLRKEAA